LQSGYFESKKLGLNKFLLKKFGQKFLEPKKELWDEKKN